MNFKSNHVIFKAIEFAAKAHAGQYRKTTKIPYIIHPLGVMEILIRHKMPIDVVVAGILHDTLEDTATKAVDIKKHFGTRVLRLVESTSEPDRSDTWENRKRHTIEHLKHASMNGVYVSCADKLHNVRSTLEDYRKQGDNVFIRFNSPKAKQKWYYTSLAQVFISRKKKHPLFREFRRVTKELFGDA